MRLQEKSIVIIGGTSGIGLSSALACQREGARLVCVGLDTEETHDGIRQLGKDVNVLFDNAAHPDTAMIAVNRAVERYGKLDGLFHVAGGSGRKYGDGPLHQITNDGWDATLRLNLASVFFSNRAAINRFLQQESGGVILNTSSVLAVSPSPLHFNTHAYAASKAAINGLTTSAAAFYAKDNIRINALAPGLVRTPMAKRAAENETIMKFVHHKQPLDSGRIGLSSDFDGAVVFLLSDESKFMTGQVIAIDGGWSVSEGIDYGK